MKKVWIAGMLFLAISLSVFAQDGRGRNREQSERGHSKRYERLAEKLDLNAQQVEELKKIDKAHFDRMQEERQKMLADKQQRRNERDEEVKKFLTDEQQKKYDELKSQQRQSHRQKGAHGKRHYRKG